MSDEGLPKMYAYPPPSDNHGGHLTTIDFAHARTHAGHHYNCHYSQAVSDTNDRSIIAFKTPTTGELHLTFTGTSSASALLCLIEAPTITADTGAPLDVNNHNRQSTNTTSVIDTSQNPDVVGQAMYFTETTMGEVTSGTTLKTIPIGSGSGPFTFPGETRGVKEWILKQDTLYAIDITSLTNDDNTHYIDVNFYEEGVE